MTNVDPLRWNASQGLGMWTRPSAKSSLVPRGRVTVRGTLYDDWPGTCQSRKLAAELEENSSLAEIMTHERWQESREKEPGRAGLQDHSPASQGPTVLPPKGPFEDPSVLTRTPRLRFLSRALPFPLCNAILIFHLTRLSLA